MPDFILAIDQGTTNTKALLVDQHGRPLFRASSPIGLYTPSLGCIEQDLLEIWQSVLNVIDSCVAHAGPSSIEAVAITNQRETAAAWDRTTGVPIVNAISWQCRRSSDICASLATHSDFINQTTGLSLDPLLSATKWSWLLQHNVDLEPRASAGEICFGTIDSWLLYKLTGGAFHVTDHSNASRTALLNLHSLDWDPQLLSLFSIPSAALPTLVSSAGMIGSVTAIPALIGVPIVSSIGDSHAASAGHGSFSIGSVKATYGTGSSLMTLAPFLPSSSPQLARTVAWTIDGIPQYAYEGNITMTGSAIQWIGEFLGLSDPVSDTFALATSVPHSAGVCFVPAMAGLGAPYWSASARGTITGLDRSSTRAHLARAAVNSIAFQIADVFGAMQAASRVPLATLQADGGATRNDALMQFQSDVLGLPVHRSSCEDLSALGAAWLAGHALNWWPRISDLESLRQPATEFQPGVFDTAQYNDWKLAVARARLEKASV
jgi:glycerol kinase